MSFATTTGAARRLGDVKNPDLREHMFATLQGLRDGGVKVETAAAIASIGQVIVASAKNANIA